jgi:transposase
MEKSQRQIENEQKRRKWDKHILGWEESGITQTEYCRIHGLNAGQFTYWKSRLRRKSDNTSLVAVQINPDMFPAGAAGRSSLRLNLENGLQIEIENDFDPSLLTVLIRTVRTL